jgi:hypothetical protein
VIVASPKDRPEFTPDGQDEAARRTYVFRVPLVLDRVRFEREIIAAGGRRVGIFDTLAELRNATTSLLEEDDPDRATMLAEIDAFRDRIIAAAEAVQATRGDDRDAALRAWSATLEDQRMNDLTIELRKHWPRLRDIEADALVFPALRGMVAARLFLVDWRGFAGKLRRDARGVKDESLVEIPEGHLAGIGAFVETLFGPTEAERKNFEPPHGGGSARDPSSAASSRP